MRTDDAAIEVMRELDRPRIYSGDANMIAEIAARAGYKPMHPVAKHSTVMSMIARSKKFQRVGHIDHLGHKHPVFVVAGDGKGGGA